VRFLRPALLRELPHMGMRGNPEQNSAAVVPAAAAGSSRSIRGTWDALWPWATAEFRDDFDDVAAYTAEAIMGLGKVFQNAASHRHGHA
jgi:hypothetical protein